MKHTGAMGALLKSWEASTRKAAVWSPAAAKVRSRASMAGSVKPP